MNDVSIHGQRAPGDPSPELPLLSASDDHLLSLEIEGTIAKIRRQLLKRDLDHNRVSPAEAATGCQFGELLDFGANGKGRRHLGAGWHVSESGFTWTAASHAVLHFALPSPARNLALEFTANGYINSRILYQDVVIEINGIPCCRLAISHKFTFSILAPNVACPVGEDFMVRFSCPNRASPRQFKRGADHRTLGIALPLRNESGKRRPAAPGLLRRKGSSQ